MGLIRVFDQDGGIYEGMVKRQEGNNDFDLEFHGFGRFIHYLGDNYSIGWRVKGFLNGFARRVEYSNGYDLLDHPIVKETVWREGFEIDRKRDKSKNKYDNLKFEEDQFLIEVTIQ
jgi:hypothetical protein